MECFAADFLRIFTKKRRNLAFRRTAGYSLSNPNISGILLKFPNFHMVVSALQSTSILSYVFGVCNLTNFYNKVCIKKKTPVVIETINFLIESLAFQIRHFDGAHSISDIKLPWCVFFSFHR